MNKGQLIYLKLLINQQKKQQIEFYKVVEIEMLLSEKSMNVY